MTQTLAAQTFGDYPDSLPVGEEYLTLNFSPSSEPRNRRWGNYGLSADFLGDYFAAFFPGDAVPDNSINQRDTVKAVVSYVANELIENAVKYSDVSAKLPISISLHLYEQEIVFKAVNYADFAAIESYQLFIRSLLSVEIDEFYTQQLEKTATGMGNSNMGIVTMMNDYEARFGWEFRPLTIESDLVQVSVIVRLDV